MDASLLTADVLEKVSEVLVATGTLATAAALSSASREQRRLLLPVLFRRLAVGPRVPASTWRSVLDAFGGKQLPVLSLHIEVPLPSGSLAEAIAAECRHLQAWHAVIRDLLDSCSSLKDLQVVLPVPVSNHMNVEIIASVPPEIGDFMANGPDELFQLPSKSEAALIRKALEESGGRPSARLVLPPGLSRFAIACIAVPDAVNIVGAVAGSATIKEWSYSGPVLDTGMGYFPSTLTAASFDVGCHPKMARRAAGGILDLVDSCPRLQKLFIHHVRLGNVLIEDPRFIPTLSRLEDLRSWSIQADHFVESSSSWTTQLIQSFAGLQLQAMFADSQELGDAVRRVAAATFGPNFELTVDVSVMMEPNLRSILASSSLQQLRVTVWMHELNKVALVVRGALPWDLRRLNIDVAAMNHMHPDFYSRVPRTVDLIACAVLSREPLPEGLSVFLDVRWVFPGESAEHLLDRAMSEWDSSLGAFRRLALQGSGDRRAVSIEVGNGFCATCLKQLEATSRFVCSGCKSEKYCGRDCQKSAWFKGGHQRRCSAIRSGLGVRRG